MLIKLTIFTGPARPADKRGPEAGPPPPENRPPPETLILVLNFQFDYLRQEKK